MKAGNRACTPSMAPSAQHPGGSCGDFSGGLTTQQPIPGLELSGKGSHSGPPEPPRWCVGQWRRRASEPCWQEGKGQTRALFHRQGTLHIHAQGHQRRPHGAAASATTPVRAHTLGRTRPASCRNSAATRPRLTIQSPLSSGWPGDGGANQSRFPAGPAPGPAPGQSAFEKSPPAAAGRRGAWRGRRSGEGSKTVAAGKSSARQVFQKIFKGAHGFSEPAAE